ncbi:MAG: hypothetical protein NT157_01175 [Candidatus Micrarchaeota archaeon]|nr:hypothetical protein [Candidatus Micrarchaeota archaeon]
MKLQFVICLLFLAGVLYAADCSSVAYKKACGQCSFDANGKMDEACFKAKQAEGLTCTTASYPIASAKYAKGECPAIDDCASELQSCQAQYASGSDKADCEEGSIAVCFAASDECVAKAANTCGEISDLCPLPGVILLASLLPVLFAKFG